ncbi:MAG: S-formylglutathione hydrolase [Gammaproteobacteria bacterium]|jgi:S-formylglutathione hydrolase|nr:S-formylglutathione hydrolase [Gammaproteobacteria bacterium]MBT3860215.1 S-formylglutathione hydrolase [Gammaproteobacteria bacterium]MBT3987507.1 S-formylglutathione hydrolase [Gammaproteobacteria bacterium]MBT4255353.1 S-formylglutathione hydrolase [Gammaproteobacteria bacterium]MBT4581755.1 S-formylglutathione hydrolase [Gammaproteobacteria bacterium]
MERLSSKKCYGGEQIRCKHFSTSLVCEMTFSVFLPEQLSTGADIKLPVLYWLSGLTCNDENFVQKAGAQKLASELGLILVAPDTSPRGEGVPDDPEGAYDLGHGAGFYVNATQEPWKKHYQMYDYIVEELPELINRKFPANGERQGIAGHSMGGHGALTIGLRNPDKYKSISAFAPIVSPMNCPWGQKALGNYLGENKNEWLSYDAVSLVKNATRPIPILVDQGSADEFLENQLKPSLLVEVCSQVGYPLNYNQRDGYDHSYFFITSFIENHLQFHSALLALP